MSDSTSFDIIEQYSDGSHLIVVSKVNLNTNFKLIELYDYDIAASLKCFIRNNKFKFKKSNVKQNKFKMRSTQFVKNDVRYTS